MLRLRRRAKPSPTSPTPSSASVAGSGTVVPFSEKAALNAPAPTMSVPTLSQSGSRFPHGVDAASEHASAAVSAARMRSAHQFGGKCASHKQSPSWSLSSPIVALHFRATQRDRLWRPPRAKQRDCDTTATARPTVFAPRFARASASPTGGPLRIARHKQLMHHEFRLLIVRRFARALRGARLNV